MKELGNFISTGYIRSPAGYIRSLDGLRALAVILVVLFHSPVGLFQFPFGWAGVNLFFILSGFLITRILLASKGQAVKPYFTNFYARRILRIFPLYFLYLFLSLILFYFLNRAFAGRDMIVREGIADFQTNYPFLLTYTYNFGALINFLAGRPYTNSQFFGHLWTLSVEEQFYLVFPLLVYYIPLRRLKQLFVFIIVAVPLFRLLTVQILLQRVPDLFWIGNILYESTPFQLDALGLGALLALPGIEGWIGKGRRVLYLPGLLFLMGVLGVTHLLVLRRYGIHPGLGSLGFDNPVYHVLNQTPYAWLSNRYVYSIPLMNGVMGLILLLAAQGRLLPRLLESKWLVVTGRISYGIYIYHLCFSYLFGLGVKGLTGKEISGFVVFFQIVWMAVYLGMLFGFAWCSYRFFESRWLRKKSRFYAVNSALT